MVNYLTTLSGQIEGGEIFSHTLAVTDDVLPAPLGVAEAVRDSWALAVAANVTGFGNAISSNVDYVDASAAVIINLTTGQLGAAAHAPFPLPGPSGVGAGGAFQVACAISLTAGTRPNGTPLRGRFYLPTIGQSVVTNGRFTSLVTAGIADTVGFFLGELIERGVQPAVWSRTLGVLQAVTSARVGNVPDTIRSRRNALAEAYEPVSITPVP